MPTRKAPRKGSLQYWPRKRIRKFLPRVNWKAIKSSKSSSEIKSLKGFICYKAGMKTALVKDNTPDSMTKGKEIAIPVTILECPAIKIFSVRFYKNHKVVGEILNSSLDKELKRKVKIPKSYSKKIDDIASKTENYDNISIIVYSKVKDTAIKKTPDLSEIGLNGSVEDKLKFVKENLDKELSVLDFFEKGELVDLRGLTKGKGTQGPVRRFGITLKSHKSEKGRRRPGSIGPWHPARVTFRVPMAGQLGTFTRAIYNNKIIDMGKADDSSGFVKDIKNYGDIKTNYIIVNGSIQGSAKRQLLITNALRQTKRQAKKNFDLLEVRK